MPTADSRAATEQGTADTHRFVPVELAAVVGKDL
jgi:hypothetical protein